MTRENLRRLVCKVRGHDTILRIRHAEYQGDGRFQVTESDTYCRRCGAENTPRKRRRPA